MKYPLIRKMCVAAGSFSALVTCFVATWQHHVSLAIVSFALSSVLAGLLDTK